jgi:hypothetical protein
LVTKIKISEADISGTRKQNFKKIELWPIFMVLFHLWVEFGLDFFANPWLGMSENDVAMLGLTESLTL